MSGAHEASGSDLDYLWRAVGEAQDASARSEKERAEARRSLDEAVSRAARLERQLEETRAREKRLKAETEKLKASLQKDSEALTLAAGHAREASELQASLLRQQSAASMKAAELEELRARAIDLEATVTERDAAIDSFKARIEGMLSLPQIKRAVEEDSRISGKEASAYEALAEKAERSRLAAEKAAAALQEAAVREKASAEALAASDADLASARAALTARQAELAAMQAALDEALERGKLSAGEKASLDGKALALRSALSEKEEALKAALAESSSLRARLDEAAVQAERLRQAAAESSARAQEQRANFDSAVAEVYELQKRSAALRAELADAKERLDAAAAALKQREADLEKVNGLLRDSKGGLTQEKEVSKRAALKVKSLEAEIDELKKKLAETADYAGKVLKAVQERDLLIGATKASLAAEQKKVTDLEIENEDLRRKNIKFSGMLKREQTDFTTRMLTSLERSAKDLKTFNLRIPAAQRKVLEPALKNLLASVNLLKGWQEYLDPETPDMEDTDLAPFVSGEVAKWERAFKVRKTSISAAILNPRLRARLAPERIKMLFYNLIKNAYERLQQGGSLRVTLKASEDGRQVILLFDDSGPGFTQEALDKLYAPFNTTDKGKAGIGLAVAARIAEKHGGTLQVSNKQQRGAIVEVRLPLGA
ncbi:MAG: ATP-binding protein [Elusimicrobia bacterium]|nr:ATP-binding protein [Elusimicrobiota bacterium]